MAIYCGLCKKHVDSCPHTEWAKPKRAAETEAGDD